MTEPRVSVVVRTFNRKKMLLRALESIAAQTWKNCEAVVVNDGGEDVEDIISQMSGRLDVVYLNFAPHEKPGRCLAATRAIEASTGEWISYLDDDDFYYPDHLETLMSAAAETGALVLYTDGNIGNEEPGPDGEYVITGVRPGASEEFSRSGFYFGCYIHLSTFCHHRKVFEDHGGFDSNLPVLEDLDFFFRLAHDYSFHHIKKFTAQYQIRTDGTNAVTGMRREFRATQEMLCRKYLHIAVADMMLFIVEGRARLLGLVAKVEDLAERVKHLEEISGLERQAR